MLGQLVLPELKTDEWIKIAMWPRGWRLGGMQKEIPSIWMWGIACPVVQRHASNAHVGICKKSNKAFISISNKAPGV